MNKIWWSVKPNISELTKVLQYREDYINALIKNGVLKIAGCTYRLEEVKEGVRL